MNNASTEDVDYLAERIRDIERAMESQEPRVQITGPSGAEPRKAEFSEGPDRETGTADEGDFYSRASYSAYDGSGRELREDISTLAKIKRLLSDNPEWVFTIGCAVYIAVRYGYAFGKVVSSI